MTWVYCPGVCGRLMVLLSSLIYCRVWELHNYALKWIGGGESVGEMEGSGGVCGGENYKCGARWSYVVIDWIRMSR